MARAQPFIPVTGNFCWLIGNKFGELQFFEILGNDIKKLFTAIRKSDLEEVSLKGNE